MRHVSKRLALPLALLLLSLVSARARVQALTSSTSAPPQFLISSSSTAPYPYYQQLPFDGVPVGKTLVVPIAVSGSGPMTYSVTSGSKALAPIIKTGYPVMNISVTYSGYPSASGSFPFSALYTFDDGADGGNPYAGLVSGSDGNLYGTTIAGGGAGDGTVFQITTSGSLTTLYSFSGTADGAAPYATLIQGTSGELYGATEAGGASGAGTIFGITTTGSLTSLYSFTGGADGANPYGSLYQGAAGNLFGTTEAGGSGYGTIFELSATGQLTTLYTFTGGNDGANPYSGLILGSNGNFYGTTAAGGAYSAGTIYEITASGSLTTLYSFTGSTDGANPRGGLVEGKDGNYYGTTVAGGSDAAGTIFQLTSSGSFNTIYGFDGTDGQSPYSSLIQVNGGYLYGTTTAGGKSALGTIYQIATSGSASFNSIYSFGGGGDGGTPYAPLVQGTGGILYGTAEIDGSSSFGTVYAITTGTVVPFSGTMTFALLRDMAPVTCGYISAFAESGSYNGLDFFRITNLAGTGEEPTFIAQTGDATETGTGSPGFAFDNEFSPSLIFDGQGQLAMANSGIDQTTFRGTNGSQFFITQNPLRSLDFGYTIFGQLIKGFDVMEKVMSVPLQSDGSSPVTPVVMNSVTVTEDNTDAIMLVNAAGAAPNGTVLTVNATDPSGNKAVIVSGTSSTTGLSLDIATYDDTINDPPIIEPDPNVSAMLHQSVSLPLKGEDLEFDYLITGAEALSNPIFATIKTSGNIATVTPSASTPIGGVSMGLYVYQPFTSTDRSDPYDQAAVEVGLGSGKLTPEPSWFYGAPSSTLAAGTSTILSAATTFGTFLVSDPGLSPGDFTATVNWGDESALATGSNSVTVAQSGYLPTTYNVTTSPHIYSHPGIYPLNVTVSNTNGGVTQIQNTAIISAGPIYPLGRTFAAPKGVANGLIATFMDKSVNVIAGDYTATINWGDGSVGAGIVRGSNAYFQVYGKHKYTGGNSYPVDVAISNITVPNNSPGYAWSTANVSGVPTHQPPFAQSHIVGQIGNPGYGPNYLDEDVTLINSGDLPSGAITLRFYLSTTADTDPIDSNAILLNIGKGTTYKADSVPAGGAIQGTVSDIIAPSGVTSRGKYIIMQVITSDPIGNHMNYPRAFADPYPLIE